MRTLRDEENGALLAGKASPEENPAPMLRHRRWALFMYTDSCAPKNWTFCLRTYPFVGLLGVTLRDIGHVIGGKFPRERLNIAEFCDLRGAVRKLLGAHISLG